MESAGGNRSLVGDRPWGVPFAVDLQTAAGSYVQKTLDDLTKGRQSPDPEQAWQQMAFGARLVLLWGIGLGLVMTGLGTAAVVVGLSR